MGALLSVTPLSTLERSAPTTLNTSFSPQAFFTEKEHNIYATTFLPPAPQRKPQTEKTEAPKQTVSPLSSFEGRGRSGTSTSTDVLKEFRRKHTEQEAETRPDLSEGYHPILEKAFVGEEVDIKV